MVKKKILIAMLEIGNGHKAPAIALQKQLNAMYPGKYDVEVIELAQQLGSKKLFRLYHKLWVKGAFKAPKVFTAVYHITDNKFSNLLEKLFLTGLKKRTKEYIETARPDLLIGTHFTCLHVFSMLKKDVKTPVFGVNTDPFDAHHVWALPNIDRFFVFSEKAKELLSKKGVGRDTIVVYDSLYPLDPKHSKKLESKEQVRKKLGISSEKAILIFGGAEGGGQLSKFIKKILENNLEFQLMVVCGRNEKLKQELEQLPRKTNLKIFGFMTNMEELIQSADIVMGKPGASQTFEVLVKNKPIIFSSHMRNEYPTLKFVTENKMGWYAPTTGKLVNLLKNIQNNPSVLDETSKNIASMNIRSCTPELAKYIDSYLEKKSKTPP